MALPGDSFVTLEEYFKMRENSEDILEYIDGNVFMSPSPSTKHQRVSSKLQTKFGIFLQGNLCEVFAAPYNIELKKDGIEGTKIVIPDLSIIYDKTGFTDARYIGVPTLIVEILSPSNQSHDLVTKLNIYMEYGVKEYWIVNPILNVITVYILNAEDMYEQYDIKAQSGKIKSKVLNGLNIDLQDIF
ncbi:endonuclease [Bacillus sp. V3-13]|uniref:Uma2 family endonuclease n=1 Tax=Bacillus sp. V3-13 TaxID=2053728 RepID=UPI000C783EEB|nr:Uma2 family endonuclease [Bacillus sp. V3-13]PLR75983.1 endonuclease [Bacillus sp. V3-13]